MADTAQQGFFRSQTPTPVYPVPTGWITKMEVKTLPVVSGEVVKPMPGECRVTVSYMPDRPDLPGVAFAGGSCYAGVEVAFAVSLAAILKSSFFTPIPVR